MMVEMKVPSGSSPLRSVLLRAAANTSAPRPVRRRRCSFTPKVPYDEAEAHPRLLELRPHARLAGRQRRSPTGSISIILDMPVEETFFRMVRFQEFDVAELSLVFLHGVLVRGSGRFIAIPVFPSRFFRHSCIYVSAKSGIREPKDLIGKKIGVPEYQMTAPVWIAASAPNITACRRRRDLFDRRRGGAGRPEKQRARPAAQHQGRVHPARQDLVADACATARSTPFIPRANPRPYDGVQRAALFENYREVERDYYRQTDVSDHAHGRDPARHLQGATAGWRRSLFKAFVEAQRRIL